MTLFHFHSSHSKWREWKKILPSKTSRRKMSKQTVSSNSYKSVFLLIVMKRNYMSTDIKRNPKLFLTHKLCRHFEIVCLRSWSWSVINRNSDIALSRQKIYVHLVIPQFFTFHQIAQIVREKKQFHKISIDLW